MAKLEKLISPSIIETAHYQAFFAEHLPSLTDFGGHGSQDGLLLFLRHLLFSGLDAAV